MKNYITAKFAALASALLLTLASPGHSIWALAYIAFIPMLLSISKNGKGFFTGWFFGFIYLGFNLRWVVTAVSEFGGSPFAVGTGVAVLFAALLALFWGVFGWIYQKKQGACMLLAGVAVALEIVRSTAFTGLPMLNLAHTQYTFLPAIQIAEIAGEHAVSLIVAYFNIAVASVFTNRNRQSIALAAVLVLSSIAYGYVSVNRAYAGNSLNVKLIQPAYSQKDKWDPEKKYDITVEVAQMVRDTELENYDLVMLPETAFPAFLNPDFTGYHVLSIAGEITPVLSGGIRFDNKDGVKTYYNSVFMFNKESVSLYDKRHLVPFGEYFPLKSLFKPIDYYFFKGAEDFKAGTEPRVFAAGRFSAAPMVCYESMYSQLVRSQVLQGADVVTVVTNDSWFGNTSGPYQHLATDVLRAVEFRKPVLRAAQSGITACIEPNGNIQKRLDTGEKGFIECDVTTYKGLTLFATGGYGWFAVYLFVAWYISRRRGRR